jgi:hypothetical protein
MAKISIYLNFQGNTDTDMLESMGHKLVIGAAV